MFWMEGGFPKLWQRAIGTPSSSMSQDQLLQSVRVSGKGSAVLNVKVYNKIG